MVEGVVNPPAGDQSMAKVETEIRSAITDSLGDGRQGISWIHEHDMNWLFARATSDDGMNGAYLATAPHPVSNAEFMRELRRALEVPFGLPAMVWMVVGW